MKQLLAVVLLLSASVARAQPAPDVFARLPVVPGPVPGEPGLVLTRTASTAVCGGVRVGVRRLKVKPVDADTYAMLALTFPGDLDFRPDRRAIMERSRKRFEAWITGMQTASMRVVEHASTTTLDATDHATALARATQVRRRMAELLLRAEIPRDVRTGKLAPEKTEAFCANMAEVAEPLILAYENTLASCHAAGELAGAGWWTLVC